MAELAQSLGYWAARWLEVPGQASGVGIERATTALAGVPALGPPDAAFPDLLTALGRDDRWPAALGSLGTAVDAAAVPDRLSEVVTAATLHYRTHAVGEPIMLVHAATAPNAALRVLPSIPRDQWPATLQAAWAATAAITMIYNPTNGPDATPPPTTAADPDDVFARAVEHRDEHVIKLADTALDVFERTGDPQALAAAVTASELIDPE